MGLLSDRQGDATDEKQNGRRREKNYVNTNQSHCPFNPSNYSIHHSVGFTYPPPPIRRTVICVVRLAPCRSVEFVNSRDDNMVLWMCCCGRTEQTGEAPQQREMRSSVCPATECHDDIIKNIERLCAENKNPK